MNTIDLVNEVSYKNNQEIQKEIQKDGEIIKQNDRQNLDKFNVQKQAKQQNQVQIVQNQQKIQQSNTEVSEHNFNNNNSNQQKTVTKSLTGSGVSNKNQNQPNILSCSPDDYISRELFSSNKVDIKLIRQIKINEKINQKLKKQYSQKKITVQQQYKAVEFMNKKIKQEFENGQNLHLVRVIDLLYKKFVLFPQKYPQNTEQQIKKNLYKPEPILGQTFYYFPQPQKQKQQKMTKQNTVNLKRSQSGQSYIQNQNDYQNNYQNQGNESNGHSDLQSIANSYVKSIRKNNNKGVYEEYNNNGYQQQNQLNSNINNNNNYNYNQPQFMAKQQPQYFPPANPNQIIHNSIHNPIQIVPSGNNSHNPNLFIKPFSPSPPHLSYPIPPFSQAPIKSVFQDISEQKTQRFNQQRTIAKTFVKDGYGLNIVRNYLGPQIDGGVYNRAITSIIRESYKKLEEYLSQKCMIKIHIMTSSEFSLIKTPLVHCRNILRSQDLKTYFKFIAMTYNFGKMKPTDLPTADQAMSLYNAILRGLHDRKNAKENAPKHGMGKELSRR